jgi:hypothetical protein
MNFRGAILGRQKEKRECVKTSHHLMSDPFRSQISNRKIRDLSMVHDLRGLVEALWMAPSGGGFTAPSSGALPPDLQG